MRAVDAQMHDTRQDGQAMGEVVMRGNNVMSGYFRDEAATSKAFTGGWFHSGDLAVWHPDGTIELRDRGKDIIISGGENISSIEVEQTIAAHPAVLECAVIGILHPHWGERPKAFVTLHDTVTAAPKRSSRSAASASPTTTAPTPSSSGHYRKPRPARSRSSGCATGNGRGKTSELAGYSTRNLRRDGAPHHSALLSAMP